MTNNNSLKIAIACVATLVALSSCSVFQNPGVKTVAEKPVESSATVVSKPEKKAKKTPTKKQKQEALTHNATSIVENPMPKATENPINSSALNGEWTIQQVDGKKVGGDDRPYINFESSTGNFYSSNGCNILNGNFEIKAGGKISFTNIISTLKMCSDAPFEFLINQAINQADAYVVKTAGNESYLTLFSAQSKPIMILRRHNLGFANGAWQVAEINGHKNVLPTMKFVIDIPELKIHGNTGCNIMNGSILIDPDVDNSLQFMDIATTRMMCPNENLEQSLLVALEEVETAKRTADGNLALFDSHGRRVLLLRAIDVSELDE